MSPQIDEWRSGHAYAEGFERPETQRLSAEHGKIEMQKPSGKPKIGDKLEWIVGYGDTTVCLHDEMVGIRSGNLEVVWPVLARGKVT